ncbi:hypothetical protein QT397_18980 [Microbulbifer sp. MKSA007]|nr:hypothetical protein QT397_18980 [Microbulbifer sp. MKSA007]
MKFEFLLGKRAIGSAYSKDYTEWAESLLYENVDSENVAILASMGYERDPDPEEIETYFQKCLKDLGLAVPLDKDALKIYAQALCELIISGELEPEQGVGMLEGFLGHLITKQSIVFGMDSVKISGWSMIERFVTLILV